MAGAERIAASAITATASRPAPSPLRNFRPAFEDIMLTGSADRAAVPQKLATALGSLMESARERGVEAQVDGILRMYASEIKNDIVLLTISRLRDMVQSLPPERLGQRLAEIPHLMREFPQAADTVPEIVMNAERLEGGGRLGLEQMRKMIRSVVGRSRSLCPKELFSAMKSDYESGRFDSIAGVAEARTGAAPRAWAAESPHADQAPVPLPASQSEEAGLPQDMPRFAASAQEVPDCLHARPEMVWCDEVKAKRTRRDEPGPVFENVAHLVRGERGREPEGKAEMRAEPPARVPEPRLLRPVVHGARAAEAEANEAAPRPQARKTPDAAAAKQNVYGREEAAPQAGRTESRKVAPKDGDAPKPKADGAKAEAPREAAPIANGRPLKQRIAKRVILSPEMAIIRVRRAISSIAARPRKPKQAATKDTPAERRAGRKARARMADGAGAHKAGARAAARKAKNAKDTIRAKTGRPEAKTAKALEKKKPKGTKSVGLISTPAAGRRREAKAAVSEKQRSAKKRLRTACEGGPRRKMPRAKMHAEPRPAQARRKAPGDGQAAARKRRGAAAKMALLGLWSGVHPWRRRALKSALPALRWPASRS